MKLRRPGLTLIVAMALLTAVASSASATTITSSAGATPTITASAGVTQIHPGTPASFLTVTCLKSSISATITAHGAGVTASGPVSQLTFSECSDVVTVLTKGALEIHGSGTTGDGTLTSSGAEIRLHTSDGPVCTLKTSASDLGTVTGGKPAKIDINSAPIHTTGFLCPTTSTWTALHVVGSPGELSVH
jgi:hypothetical protein